MACELFDFIVKLLSRLNDFKEDNHLLFRNTVFDLDAKILAGIAYIVNKNSTHTTIEFFSDWCIIYFNELESLLYNINTEDLLKIKVFFILYDICQKCYEISLIDLNQHIINKIQDGGSLSVCPIYDSFEDYIDIKNSIPLIYAFIFWVRTYKEGLTRYRFHPDAYPLDRNRDDSFTFN